MARANVWEDGCGRHFSIRGDSDSGIAIRMWEDGDAEEDESALFVPTLRDAVEIARVLNQLAKANKAKPKK